MGARARLIRREALIDRMEELGWSNRRLAKYADVVHTTIDNLVFERTQSLNSPNTAKLISEALGLPMDYLFAVENRSAASSGTKSQKVAA